MYYKCLEDDKQKYWPFITDEHYIYCYCLNIKDRPEMREQLISGCYLYLYCKYVKDRKELWSKMTDSHWIYEYCKYVKDRPELKDNICG